MRQKSLSRKTDEKKNKRYNLNTLKMNIIQTKD